MSIRVGIVGISGFGGGEAMRLVATHPSFELIYAAGEGSAGSRLVDRFPGVPAKLAEVVIEKWDSVTLPKLDLLFASLPTGASAKALPERNLVIAMGVVDNLGKGAAGQAVQNANLAWAENRSSASAASIGGRRRSRSPRHAISRDAADAAVAG
jgi:N-acetyl-gamma-glutamylphosphate reductase